MKRQIDIDLRLTCQNYCNNPQKHVVSDLGTFPLDVWYVNEYFIVSHSLSLNHKELKIVGIGWMYTYIFLRGIYILRTNPSLNPK